MDDGDRVGKSHVVDTHKGRCGLHILGEVGRSDQSLLLDVVFGMRRLMTCVDVGVEDEDNGLYILERQWMTRSGLESKLPTSQRKCSSQTQKYQEK
jgi:hypothetical protein